MARLSSDGKYVTVELGDTLWDIAEQYLKDADQWRKLATINNIPIHTENGKYICHIFPGDEIKLYADGTSVTSSTTSNKPTNVRMGLISNGNNTLYATWEWSKDKTASYKVSWTYETGQGIRFGDTSTISIDKDNPNTAKQSTYQIPSNATVVYFKVKPIAENKKNSSSSAEWTAEWSTELVYNVSFIPPNAPSVPSVTIDKYTLTATLDNISTDGYGSSTITSIEFQVVKDNTSAVYASGTATIVSSRASYSCSVAAGGEYKVRCRACSVYNNISKSYGAWSNYSNNIGTIPASSAGITTIRATSKTSVYLEWAGAGAATSYNIEYATKKEYFDGSDQTTTKTGATSTHYEVSGLESGHEYFFRVQAVNEKGESAWTDLKSVVVGKDPSAPTTWSSTTTAIVGEPLNLYWVHNSQDGSSQTYAELELIIDGVTELLPPIENSTDEDEKDKTSVYAIDTSKYPEGTVIQWRVRTAGVTKAYGEWSVQRRVDIYAPPTLELSMLDASNNSISTVTSFPFYISGLTGPKTQAPISYHLSVTANEAYDTVDNIGNEKTVSVGEQLYSKYFDITAALKAEFAPSNIDLTNNISYTATCVATLDSGLTVEKSIEFNVSWSETSHQPNAEIGVNTDSYSALIRPYCEQGTVEYHKVTLDSSGIYVIGEVIDKVQGVVVPGAHTETGELVYEGMTADGVVVYYCTVEQSTPITDVYLAVYRREFDGSFTEIASGLDGTISTVVTDPHPALDYARYRITATSKTTGAVGYFDIPGYPVECHAVIIQWEEAWSSFNATMDEEPVQPPWSGSLLKLPYNIDVSDSHRPDVSVIEYIGRSHPISYYGTQLGQTATWNVEIAKDDEETLYSLRRLANWMGDAYVREPSGSGYWANVTVSFNQKHKATTIPVTLSITRVEGGV